MPLLAFFVSVFIFSFLLNLYFVGLVIPDLRHYIKFLRSQISLLQEMNQASLERDRDRADHDAWIARTWPHLQKLNDDWAKAAKDLARCKASEGNAIFQAAHDEWLKSHPDAKQPADPYKGQDGQTSGLTPV